MRRGALSYSKARALTRVATPENEEKLVDFALHGTASHVEKLVRGWRRVDRLEGQANGEDHEEELHRARELSVFPDEDGSYVIRGRLDPEVGAVLMRALDAADHALGGRSDERSGPPLRADAIGLLAERALQTGFDDDGKVIGRADRFQVVMHVDADGFADADGSADPSGAVGAVLDDLVHVPAGTSRRLACDAGRVIMMHTSDGSVLDVGRKTRIVPPAIRRVLDHRDGGCRFPGCGNRFCDAHHIEHWIEGGKTRIDNLVLLCRRHHRAVHEEGFRVEIADRYDTTARFYWPDGRRFPDVPPPPILPDPVADLKSNHGRLGIRVGPDTTTPLWNGEPFDVGWAVHVMWSPPKASRTARPNRTEH